MPIREDLTTPTANPGANGAWPQATHSEVAGLGHKAWIQSLSMSRGLRVWLTRAVFQGPPSRRCQRWHLLRALRRDMHR